MRLSLHNRLRCPISGSPLELDAIEWGTDAEGARAVRTGILWSRGGYWYPIVNYVPVLLVFRRVRRRRPIASRSRANAACRPRLPRSGPASRTMR